MKTKRPADVLTGVLAMSLAAGVVLHVRLFPDPVPGVPGPAIFPVILAVVMFLLGAGLAVSAFRRGAPVEGEVTGSAEISRWRMPAVLGTTMLYATAMPVVGFVSGSAIYMTIVMRLLGYRHIARAVAVALVVAFVVYGLFAQLLDVPLPAGWLG